MQITAMPHQEHSHAEGLEYDQDPHQAHTTLQLWHDIPGKAHNATQHHVVL